MCSLNVFDFVFVYVRGWTTKNQQNTTANKAHQFLQLHTILPGSVLMLVRKKVNNPLEFFDKTYNEYKKGFSANG